MDPRVLVVRKRNAVGGGGDSNTNIIDSDVDEAQRSPISKVQEICMSRRWPLPIYETEFLIFFSRYESVKIEGATDNVTFHCCVFFNSEDLPFAALGISRSKKEAKNSAARAIIVKLADFQIPETQESDDEESFSTTFGSDDDYNITFIGSGGNGPYRNYINLLQEMCMSRRWPLPLYETKSEVGMPHERHFTIACTIRNYREFGQGNTKKFAKHTAAHKMWTRLQEDPLDYNQIRSCNNCCKGSWIAS